MFVAVETPSPFGPRNFGQSAVANGVAKVAATIKAKARANILNELAQPYRFGDGISVGVGSLPHRDAPAAAAFAMAEFDVATSPSLPQLSPHEAMIAQASQPLDGDGFTGLRTFLDLAARVRHGGAPVKWQFVGPVTLGVELMNGGLSSNEAFAQATATVRSRLVELSALVTDTMPA